MYTVYIYIIKRKKNMRVPDFIFQHIAMGHALSTNPPRWRDHLLPQLHPGHHGGVPPGTGLRAEEGAQERPAGAGGDGMRNWGAIF